MPRLFPKEPVILLETIAVTDRATMNEAAACRTLKPELSRSDVPVVAKKQITVPVLEKNSFGKGVQVSGQTLKRGADHALKTIKKAVAFVLPLLNDDGSPHDSGNSVDDIDAKVLHFMFCLLEGKNTVDDVKEEEAKDDVVAKAKCKVKAVVKHQHQIQTKHPPSILATGSSFMAGLLSNCMAQRLLRKNTF
jgi:hypothetical protein